MTNRTDAIVTVTSVAVLIACAIALVLPGSSLRAQWDGFIARRQTAQAIAVNWDTLEASRSRLDTSAAPVTVVEFSDYQCPFCRAASAMLDSIIAQTPHLGVAYRHFPLTGLHPSAEGAARAAICAETQGRFREMHHYLMSTTSWQADQNWAGAAAAAGVGSISEFTTCLTSNSTTARLADDQELARRFKITSTPTFITRRGVTNGVAGSDALRNALLGQ